MSTASNWQDVKAKARAADPAWDTDERVTRRVRMREEMLASVSGTQLAGVRHGGVQDRCTPTLHFIS